MAKYRNRLIQKSSYNTSFWFTGVVADPENPGMSIPNYAFIANATTAYPRSWSK